MLCASNDMLDPPFDDIINKNFLVASQAIINTAHNNDPNKMELNTMPASKEIALKIRRIGVLVNFVSTELISSRKI